MNVLLLFARPLYFRVFVSVLYAIPCWGYLLGFAFSFSPAQLTHGVAEWCMLAYLQVLGIPVYAAMEAYGISLAVFAPFQKVYDKTLAAWLKFGRARARAKTKKGRSAGVGGDDTAFGGFKIVQKEGKDAALRIAEMAAESGVGNTSVVFWKERLAGAPPVLPLITDAAPSDGSAAQLLHEMTQIELPDLATAALREHAAGMGLQSHDVATAALAWVAAVHAREADVVVLLDAQWCDALIRLDANPHATMASLAAECSRQLEAAALHELSMPELIECGPAEWMQLERPFPLRVTAQPARHMSDVPDAAILISAPSLGPITILYDTSLITEAGAIRWTERLARCMLASASTPMSAVALMGSEEAHTVAIASNRTATTYPSTHSIASLFRETAAANPRAIALTAHTTYTGAAAEEISYSSLNARTDTLALAIHGLGVLSEHQRLVALIFHRSVEMVVAIFGVIKAGGAYLPIEPDFPAARVGEILADSLPRLCLLHDGSLARLCPAESSEHLLLVSNAEGQLLNLVGTVIRSEVGGSNAADSIMHPGPSDLVYVMYTSGTTGKPKGVMVEHGPLLMRVNWLQEAFTIGVNEVVPFKTQFIFGVSEWELFWTLTTGASLAIIPPEIVKQPQAMAMALIEHSCAVAFLTPSHVEALLPALDSAIRTATLPKKGTQGSATPDAAPSVLQLCGGETKRKACPAPELRHVVCCGEALTVGTVRRFYERFDDAEIHNVYGPTEGSMSWYPCSRDCTHVHIGKPISNTAILLVDAEMKPVPIGVPGEIVFGACIARGYLNRPELTAEKFVPNPLWLKESWQADGGGLWFANDGEADGLRFADRPISAATHAREAGSPNDKWPRSAFAGQMQLARDVPPAPYLYKTGDLGVRLPSGDLRFCGRVDRQVKVRGYRIELEAVETVIAMYRPPLKRFAVVAVAVADSDLKELVAFVGLGEVNPGAISGSVGLLAHCAAYLPAYMVPSRVVALSTFPTLPNGKINLASLSSGSITGEVMERADASDSGGGAIATDSLGVVRTLSSGAAALARETRIADLMRAFLMYGVIMDHWAGCADGSSCRAIMEDIVWRQPPSSQNSLLWLDTLIRMIGNYKCMSGFLMISAYVDSGFAKSTRFGKSDVVVALTYLQMIWVLDPLVFALCSAFQPDRCYGDHNEYVGVHRWYLLLMLAIKLALAAFRIVRLPPLLQCLLVTFFGFMLPPEIGCMTDMACSRGYDTKAWVSVYPALDPLLRLLFMGAFKDAWNMHSSIFMRYYVLFAAQYFWTYYYGRSTLRWLMRVLLSARASSVTAPSRAARVVKHSQGTSVMISALEGKLSAARSNSIFSTDASSNCSTRDFVTSSQPNAEHAPACEELPHAFSDRPSHACEALAAALSIREDEPAQDDSVAHITSPGEVHVEIDPTTATTASVAAEQAATAAPAASQPTAISFLSVQQQSKPARRWFGVPSAQVAFWLAAIIAPVSACLAFLLIELIEAALIGPRLYDWMQQDLMQTQMPQLIPTSTSFALLSLSVLFLLAVVACIRQPPAALRRCGSTTLGCYVLHMYFTFPFSLASRSFASLPATLGYTGGFIVQLLLVLLLPIIFQCLSEHGSTTFSCSSSRCCFEYGSSCNGWSRLPSHVAPHQPPRHTGTKPPMKWRCPRCFMMRFRHCGKRIPLVQSPRSRTSAQPPERCPSASPKRGWTKMELSLKLLPIGFPVRRRIVTCPSQGLRFHPSPETRRPMIWWRSL